MSDVLVTGLGVVTPLGRELEPVWSALMAGRPRFTPQSAIYLESTAGLLAGRVSEDDAHAIRDEVGPASFGDSSRYGIYAARRALSDAGIEPEALAGRRCAVVLGNNEAECDLLDEHLEGDDTRWRAASYSGHSIADNVARGLGVVGPSLVIHNTCASSNTALETAQRLITRGVVDLALVGGTDAFSKKVWIGFHSLRALGSAPCRPFARDRRFITISEGAAILVLQRAGSLGAHAKPYARLLGVSRSNDAHHPTQPRLEGVRACHERLFGAGRSMAEVDLIYAHGTGTRANDAVEGELFETLYPSTTAVTAIKGTVGHMMATAGAIAAVSACLSLRHQQIPPTVISPDDFDFTFDLVTSPRTSPLKLVQSNAFGFGGNNAIALFERP